MRPASTPWRLALAAVAAVSLSVVSAGDQRPLILTHYMPWYASKPVSGQWGWHWTMDHFDPEKIGEDGRREAASHDYPLIGLYDSGDPDVLECQVLLMKLAGIDGVVIDWYGTRDYFDYATIHENTRRLIPFLEKAGLSFAICYEDQSIGHMVAGKVFPKREAVAEAHKVMAWVEQNWFSRDSYLKVDGRPVLLVFGPQYFNPAQWGEVTAAFATKPQIHVLPFLVEKYRADGGFGWPPVDGGKTVGTSEWKENLGRLHQRRKNGEPVMAVAFPGFHDIYEEAKLHEPYGFIDDLDGATFRESLDFALASGAPMIQIATWNDYGEGTQIEPARKHGYRFLEELQRHTPELPFAGGDLRLPVRLYRLRKKHAENPEAMERLNRAGTALFRAEIDQARQLLDQVNAASAK